MSKKAVREVVGKLIADSKIVVNFKQDPDTFLSDFELTPDEISGIKKLNVDDFDNIEVDPDGKIALPRIGALYLKNQ